MARIPKIWCRKDCKAWFVTIRGARHNLVPDKKEATDRFHNLTRRSLRPCELTLGNAPLSL